MAEAEFDLRKEEDEDCSLEREDLEEEVIVEPPADTTRDEGFK